MPRFYLRNFSSNPNVKSPSNQKIWALDHTGVIESLKINKVCAIPNYNTERQNKKLTRLEKNRFNPALKSLKSEYPPTNADIILNLILFSCYLLTGHPKIRHIFTKSLEDSVCESAGIKRINRPEDYITGLFSFTEQTAWLFFHEVSQWIINFIELKNQETFITCDQPILVINNQQQGDLFRIDFSNINYKYTTYRGIGDGLSGDNLETVCNIKAVNCDYPTLIYFPLSPKQAMLLHSDTESIRGLETLTERKNIELSHCLNMQIYANSIWYAFSNQQSILSDLSGLIKWA